MNNYEQLDIFGNSIPLDIICEKNNSNKHGGRITKKSLFRSINGYKNGFYCKNCIYFKTTKQNREYFKCEKLGVTSSNATDIRKNDIACRLYK